MAAVGNPLSNAAEYKQAVRDLVTQDTSNTDLEMPCDGEYNALRAALEEYSNDCPYEGMWELDGVLDGTEDTFDISAQGWEEGLSRIISVERLPDGTRANPEDFYKTGQYVVRPALVSAVKVFQLIFRNVPDDEDKIWVTFSQMHTIKGLDAQSDKTTILVPDARAFWYLAASYWIENIISERNALGDEQTGRTHFGDSDRADGWEKLADRYYKRYTNHKKPEDDLTPAAAVGRGFKPKHSDGGDYLRPYFKRKRAQRT